ncbi:helicase carboxy-terminal domain protein [Rhizoctonia solani AG-3 Rhs1AP]|uniref:DNA 3'-5' helicase n=1 Tax=Rhizoctonia solani AG-3 Rhs1AP TaxID=1086054 RepID=X8J1R2_9AGAM|nr:helicase carboxy-terminal domain protein [Rhizoctonia solani AG-3 Rhs1AP]
MQEAIKQSLRFDSNAFEVNLGNRRSNIAYSVHRLKNVSTVASEILEYFPSKTHVDGFTLIFVDSRKTGNQILYKLRKHLDPDLHGAVQLYHATRSEYDKEVMAAGFELAIGFLILICTEALTMGVDFRKVSLVIQVLAPTDAETLVQRTGRCGRNPTELGQAVVLVQDSVFEDSKVGQKRLEKSIKKEDAPNATKSNPNQVARLSAKDKARRIPKEIHPAIVDFVNTVGCRMEVLDKTFDNPPTPEGHICSCDNCLHARGESTFRERMAARAGNDAISRGDVIEEHTQGPDATEALEDQDNSVAEDQVEMKPNPKSKASTSRRYRPGAQRDPYVDALNEWVDLKYNSQECKNWDITKDWILTDKQIKSIAMHPGMTAKEDLKSIKPNWVHYCRWAVEVFGIVASVNQKLQEDRAREADAKRVAEEERRTRDQEKHEQATKRKAEQIAEQQEQENRQAEASIATQMSTEPGSSTEGQTKRPRITLKPNATPEERAEHVKKQAERKKASNRARYQRQKAEKSVKKEAIDQHDVLASAHATPQRSLPPQEPALTLEAKQEQVNEHLLLNDTTTPTTQTTPASALRMHSYHVPAPMPPTPSSSSSTRTNSKLSTSVLHSAPDLTFTWVMEDGMKRQQVTPQTNPRAATASFDTEVKSPSTQSRIRRRPKMKIYTPDQLSNPSPSL